MPYGLRKRPRNPNQLRKMIVDIATGQIDDRAEAKLGNPVEQAAGRVGGPTRARSLTPERRSEIAKSAAKARWHEPA